MRPKGPIVDRDSRSAHNHLTGVRLDRLAEHRDDPARVAGAWRDEATRVIPMWRNRSLLARNGDRLEPVVWSVSEAEAMLGQPEPTLLGHDGTRHWFLVSVPEAQAEAVASAHSDADFTDLRLASLDLDADTAGVLAYAKALHYWQYRHRFCGVCGAANDMKSAGHRLRCTNTDCGRQSFPRIDPAIIVLVTHGDACLLGRNAAWPEGRYSTLAGFVEPGESLEDAVAREVWEEAGVRLRGIRYRSSQPWPFPASTMCGFQAEAESRDVRTGDELESVRWFTARELADAVQAREVVLSPPVSIAFRLQAEWFAAQGGGDLEAITAGSARFR